MKKIIFLLLISSAGLLAQTDFFEKLSTAAIELTNHNVVYDPTYYKIKYPNGDVPDSVGVCTDVIIRTYRKVGIDLQVKVHDDMSNNFDEYPAIWGLTSTDTNIDHRRVPNLMTYFKRKGITKVISTNPGDYVVGDIVCWDLGGGVTHIGIMVNKKSDDGKRFLIVHNIGGGQVLADCLFKYEIIGHYAYGK